MRKAIGWKTRERLEKGGRIKGGIPDLLEFIPAKSC